jgi:hypothetical protein
LIPGPEGTHVPLLKEQSELEISFSRRLNNPAPAAALLIPLGLSVVGLYVSSPAFNTMTILMSAAITVIIVVSDSILVFYKKGLLGRFILGFGLLFWFWIEAVSISVIFPQFQTPYTTYPYFGKILEANLVAFGIFCVNTFAFCCYAGWHIIPIPRFIIRRVSGRADSKNGFHSDVILLIISGLYWVPILVMFGGNYEAATTVLMEMRSSAGGPQTSPGLLLHLQWPAVFAGAVSIARLLVGARGSRLLQLSAIFVIVPGVFLSSTRFYLAFLLLPGLIVLTSGAGAGLSDARRRRRVALAFGFAVVVAVMVQGAIRSSGGLSVFLGGESNRSLLDEGLKHGFFGYEHFSAALIAIDLVERRGEFFHEPLIPFFFTHFIPKQFGPNKPESLSWKFYNDTVTQGRRTFNVTPSIVGQYYLNWGVWGMVLGGFVLAWLARIGDYWWYGLDLRRQLMSASVCGLWFAFVFFSFRYLWPLYVQFPAFGLIIYLLASHRTSHLRSSLSDQHRRL